MDEHVTAIINEAVLSPMRWGRDDCASFSGAVAEAFIGTDPLKGIRGTYSSVDQAMQKYGAGSKWLYRTVARQAKKIGWERVYPGQAKPGAFGLYVRPEDGLLICVVAIGKGWFLGRTEHGVLHIRAHEVIRSWQCPQVSP